MSWKRTKKIVSGLIVVITGISALIAVIVAILGFPVAYEEGTEAWDRWLDECTVQNVAFQLNILYQKFRIPLILIAVGGTLWWFYRYSPRWFRLFHGNQPMSGILELEKCQQELVEYLRVPSESPIGPSQIAATQAFRRHVKQLCQILDEQSIPHPPIPEGLIFDGWKVWGDFLSNLMAVRHDIEKARRVYRENC